jgi:uncharacterized protein
MSGDREPDEDPDVLVERWRQSGLRLDREGRWWHEGCPVEHRGLAQALCRWLDQLDDGRYVVRLDADRYAYVEVEDAPYLVLTVTLEREADGVHLQLHLSDGSVEELAYATLSVGREQALYCQVRERFAARFSRAAYYLVGELIEETDDGRFALRAAGQLWPIAG